MRLREFMKGPAAVANRAPVLSFFALAFLFTWSLLPFTSVSIWVSLIALCGPVAAAVAVSLLRPPEWREFRGRLTDWRIPPRWYLLAILLPVLISALRSGIEYFVGAKGPIEPQPIDLLSAV